LFTFDDVNLAYSVGHFDIRMSQPHPPGYPLFVMEMRVLSWLRFRRAESALSMPMSSPPASAWRGRIALVNLWATWCPPCRAEIPDLIALQEKYRDQVQVIGVSQDEVGPDAVRKFAAEQHMNYPIVMSTPELEKIFTGIYALPTSFIVDRTQQIVQKHVGMLNAATTEAEARYLAGLDTNVTVEHVEDETKAMIRNAAQATKIPGVDLDKLSPAAKAAALKQLNADTCTCGCGLTLAACRINDPGCNISLPLAQKIAAEAALHQ
jgi:thiol-disulfide isomerase/thioredoxin